MTALSLLLHRQFLAQVRAYVGDAGVLALHAHRENQPPTQDRPPLVQIVRAPETKKGLTP